jgi:hypothetical protein
MLIVVAALLFQFPVFSPSNTQAARRLTERAVVATAAEDSSVSNQLDSRASSGQEVLSAAKLSAETDAPLAFEPGRLVAEPVAPVNSTPAAAVANPALPVAIEPAAVVPVYGPVYRPAYAPVYRPPLRAVSDPWQNRKWLALSIAAHSAAGFDAWSTRRVLSSVPGAQEMNPLLRPFAGNASMYAAVQVAPAVLDLVSRRMMRSRHDFLRNTWWLPQAVSAAVSVVSGVHNLGVYNSR